MITLLNAWGVGGGPLQLPRTLSSHWYSIRWTWLTLIFLNSVLSPQLRMFSGPFLGFLCPHHSLESLQGTRVSGRKYRAHLDCFPSVRDSCSSLHDVSHLENLFYIFHLFVLVSSRKITLVLLLHLWCWIFFVTFIHSCVCSTSKCVPWLCYKGLRRFIWKDLLQEDEDVCSAHHCSPRKWTKCPFIPALRSSGGDKQLYFSVQVPYAHKDWRRRGNNALVHMGES